MKFASHAKLVLLYQKSNIYHPYTVDYVYFSKTAIKLKYPNTMLAKDCLFASISVSQTTSPKHSEGGGGGGGQTCEQLLNQPSASEALKSCGTN